MTVTSTASEHNLAACEMCLKLMPIDAQRCSRCNSKLHPRKADSLQRTLALLIAACLLYIPANLYPIMYTEQLGNEEASTILGGVLLLIDLGSFPIALVIFIFSVVVPLGKISIMFYLTWTVFGHSPLTQRQRAILYRATQFVGKWSMVDVFVVAILVALVHLTGLMVIRPGVAALSFAAVVILTMIATESFDSRLIWDNGDEAKREL
ncbi:MAG: paraquat-inducible protein A [Halioglobus sp.]